MVWLWLPQAATGLDNFMKTLQMMRDKN
eukprot:COSAG02_NODE_23335_length_722_cov_0.802568_1_plen_27_part_10